MVIKAWIVHHLFSIPAVPISSAFINVHKSAIRIHLIKSAVSNKTPLSIKVQSTIVFGTYQIAIGYIVLKRCGTSIEALSGCENSYHSAECELDLAA